MASRDIDHRAIEKHVKEINKAYQRAARKYPVTVPVAGQGFTISSGATGVGIERDPQLVALLIWLGVQSSRGYANQDGYITLTGMSSEEVSVLAHALERDGLLASPSASGEIWRITDDGRVELRRLAQLRSDPAARHRYATDAFLRWLYTAAHDQRPTYPTAFLAAAESHFAGEALSGTELAYALARLAHSGLVSKIATEPETVAITIDGIDCVLSGATVSDYLNRTHPGDYYSINATNVVAGTRGNVEQHNHNNALDLSAMREFAELVKQLAPVYGMEPEEEAQLVHDAEILADETSSETAQPGRIRAAYDSVMGALVQIGTTSAALSTTIEQGQQALNIAFGS
ncbi:hypothetical protein EAO73_34970 [Streptomyces sp. col6]|uniref:hypothetical protein n=1 Tax=Streptomyces sp. col6 TaxID=2478958 RepID=UPI0011CE9397|nr:hypothetical protein [Streptomyces sp. col6]TXR94526.1 hypothetical protein EAO73_34970 [Streptomyces sp. col6]